MPAARGSVQLWVPCRLRPLLTYSQPSLRPASDVDLVAAVRALLGHPQLTGLGVQLHRVAVSRWPRRKSQGLYSALLTNRLSRGIVPSSRKRTACVVVRMRPTWNIQPRAALIVMTCRHARSRFAMTRFESRRTEDARVGERRAIPHATRRHRITSHTTSTIGAALIQRSTKRFSPKRG